MPSEYDKKHLKKLLLLGLALIWTKNVWAVGCSFSPKTFQLKIPELAVAPNVPVGSVLLARTFSAKGPAAVCPTGSPLYKSMMMGPWATLSSIPGVYETGVPGIGVRIDDFVLDGFVPLSQQIPPNQALAIMGKDVRLLFYRTGDIEPGNFPAGIVARFQLQGTNGTLGNLLTQQVVSGSVRIKSCYAKSPNIIVPMGQVQRNVFNGVGSTSPVKSFKFDMTCQGDGLPVDVSYDVMAGTSSPETGVIPLDNVEGSATGVAIKVMNNDGSPLQFNMPTRYHLNHEPSISIPLKAAYVQTNKKITAGVANATMTFTITQN